MTANKPAKPTNPRVWTPEEEAAFERVLEGAPPLTGERLRAIQKILSPVKR